MTGEKRTGSRWSVLSGVIMAIAALVAAVGGFIWVLHTVGVFDRPDRSTTSGATSSSKADTTSLRSSEKTTSSANIYAQMDPEILYKAYYQASVYPDRFDSYARQTAALKEAYFTNCLGSAQLRLAVQHQKKTAHCNQIPDISAKVKCQETDEIKVSLVLDGIAAVVGQQARYAETIAGAAATLGQKILGPTQWTRLQSEAVPLFRSVLICEAPK